jgi:putative aldouronate transport system substrate-binding protein
MKKFITLSALVILGIILVACQPKELNKNLVGLVPYTAYTEAETTVFAKLIEEETGFTVDYRQLPNTDPETRLNADLAARVKYNYMVLTPALYNNALASEGLLDLAALIEKHGPNIKSAFAGHEEVWDTAKVGDKIYGIPQKNPSPNVNNALFLRTDMFKAVGIDPATVKSPAQFKAALVALKAANSSNPNFVPFYAGNHDITAIRVAFGLGNDWMPINNKLVHWTQAPKFGEYAAYLKDLRDSGLLQDGYLTSTENAGANLFGAGNTAVFQGAWWNAPGVYPALQATLQSKNASVTSEYFTAHFDEFIGYISGLYPTDNSPRQITTDNSVVYFITIPSYMEADAVAVITWLNKKLEPATFKKLTIGTEGVHHKVENGIYKPILTPVVDGKTPFDERNCSDWFLTGTRIDDYASYWQARAFKNVYQTHSWLAINAINKATEGLPNTIGLAPTFPTLVSSSAPLSSAISEFFANYVNSTSSAQTVAAFQASLLAGNVKLTQVTTEVNAWYTK